MLPSFLPRICAVVTAPTLSQFLSSLETAQIRATFVELRVDALGSLTLDDLQTIRKHTYQTAIFCCRRQEEGGAFQGSAFEQQAMLQTANDLGFDYLDIDLQRADHIQINAKRAKIILSFHDFYQTPTLPILQQQLANMRRYQPDIFKFSVMVHNKEGAYRLLQFLLSKNPEEAMVVLGMGEAGKIVRLLSPWLGGLFTFAANGESSSAPGQMDFTQLQALYQCFEKTLYS